MKTKNKVISLAVLFLILFWIGNSIYSYYFVPGVLDDFAKCISQKGAVMYGAMDWCKFTQQQRVMFGKSFKYVTYKEYGEFPKEKGTIRSTPSWIIENQVYEKVQSFERLSHLTGCELPK